LRAFAVSLLTPPPLVECREESRSPGPATAAQLPASCKFDRFAGKSEQDIVATERRPCNSALQEKRVALWRKPVQA